MPYPVEDLLKNRESPVVVYPHEPAVEALKRMVEHDYSQLPVVDLAEHPLGLITYESLMQAATHFNLTIDKLRVGDAIIKVPFYKPDDDLFDMLDRLRDSSAVLIVDSENKLIGIVTSYDSTEYFRRRAEDMMLVQDIESVVKDLIQSAFYDANGLLDQDSLTHAVDRLNGDPAELAKAFKRAVGKYLDLCGIPKQALKPDAIEAALIELAPPKKKKRVFEDLNFGEYMELLLNGSRWKHYSPHLKKDPSALRQLLDEIREIRNRLAHFRGELNSHQRKQLRFAADWFSRHTIPIEVNISTVISQDLQHGLIVREEQVQYHAQSSENIQPVEEEVLPGGSRYAPLAAYLNGLSGEIERAELSFDQIEEIIEGELPASARNHRAWWSNDEISHTHARTWLEVGWKSSNVSVTAERAAFVRVQERETAYIQFYSRLLDQLRKHGGMPIKELSPGGQCWHTVLGLPVQGPEQAVLGFSFSRGDRFRVELYIDTGDREYNKRAFDILFSQKEVIEQAFGEKLAWERINRKRACRIAFYVGGSITDSDRNLAGMRDWAARTMVDLYRAIAEPAVEALQSASVDAL